MPLVLVVLLALAASGAAQRLFVEGVVWPKTVLVDDAPTKHRFSLPQGDSAEELRRHPDARFIVARIDRAQVGLACDRLRAGAIDGVECKDDVAAEDVEALLAAGAKALELPTCPALQLEQRHALELVRLPDEDGWPTLMGSLLDAASAPLDLEIPGGKPDAVRACLARHGARVAGLALGRETTKRCLDAIAEHCTNLVGLDLSDVTVRPLGLRRFARLEWLVLPRTVPPKAVAEDLAELPALRALRADAQERDDGRWLTDVPRLEVIQVFGLDLAAVRNASDAWARVRRLHVRIHRHRDVHLLELLTSVRTLGVFVFASDFVLAGSDLARLPSLERLEVIGPVASVAFASRCTKLRELVMIESEARDLRPLSKLTGLERLSIGLESDVPLEPLGSLRALRRLHVNVFGDHRPSSSFLGRLTALRDLGLVGARVSLKQLSRLTRLRRLSLSACEIVETDDVVLPASVRDVSLNGVAIGDVSWLPGTLRMVFLSKCTTLRDLSGLRGRRIEDWISIRGCPDLVDVSALVECTGLQELSIRKCPKIDPAQIDALRKAHPACRIDVD